MTGKRGRPRKAGLGEAVNGDVEAILRKVRTVKVKGKLYAACTDLFRALGYRTPFLAGRRFCRGAVKHRILTKKGFQLARVIPLEDMRRIAGKFVADDRDGEDEATSIVPVEYTKEEKKEREKRMRAERAASRYYGDKNLIF